MQLNDLVAYLNSTMGTQLEVVDGVVSMGVDDMEISLMEIMENSSVVLHAKIADRPAEANLEKLSEAMLAANYMFEGTGGSTISYSSDEKAYYLSRYENIAILSGESFTQILERFVNTLETWRKLVVDYRPESGKDGGAGDAPVAGDQGGLSGFNGFMQV